MFSVFVSLFVFLLCASVFRCVLRPCVSLYLCSTALCCFFLCVCLYASYLIVLSVSLPRSIFVVVFCFCYRSLCPLFLNSCLYFIFVFPFVCFFLSLSLSLYLPLVVAMFPDRVLRFFILQPTLPPSIPLNSLLIFLPVSIFVHFFCLPFSNPFFCGCSLDRLQFLSGSLSFFSAIHLGLASLLCVCLVSRQTIWDGLSRHTFLQRQALALQLLFASLSLDPTTLRIRCDTIRGHKVFTPANLHSVE